MTTAINILKPHLAINVRNVENSVEFYKKMFGIEPSKVRTGYAKFDVQIPALNFTLNQMPFSEQGALSHLGIPRELRDLCEEVPEKEFRVDLSSTEMRNR